MDSRTLTGHDHDGEHMVHMLDMGELFESFPLRLTRLEVHVKGDSQEKGWRYLSKRCMQWSMAMTFVLGQGNYPAFSSSSKLGDRIFNVDVYLGHISWITCNCYLPCSGLWFLFISNRTRTHMYNISHIHLNSQSRFVE
jgi:hypothetical protein